MKNMISVASIAACIVSAPAAAAVQTLGFDDIWGTPTVTAYFGPSVATFANYGGFDWGPRWGIVKTSVECSNYAPCGFGNNLTSGDYVGTNGFDTQGSITSPTPFKLISLQLGAAWYNNLLVSFQGTLGGNTVWTKDVRVNITGPSLILFPSGLIDTLNVTPIIDGNSVQVGFAGSGPRMTWDDFTFDRAPVGGVPEPAAWALLLTGFGLVGGVARRQRVVAA